MRVTGTVIQCIVNEKCDGIYIAMRLENGKEIVIPCSTNEPWLRIKQGMVVEEELQKVCDLLNGYKKSIDGSVEYIEGSYPKILTIEHKDR